MMLPEEFTWIFALGVVWSLLDAYGIGANDLANMFSPACAAGTLTMLQACIIAAFAEFLGAFLLGAETTETIKGDILDADRFADQPELLMLGMLCALVGSATWVIFASKKGLPVSSTNSIVGGIIGVGISAFGGGAIQWGYSGVAKIITSWFVSPVAAGIVTAIIYLPTRYFILESPNSFARGIRTIPIYFFGTALIGSFYILYKAIPDDKAGGLSAGVIVGIAFGVAAAATAFSWFFFVPWVKRRVVEKEAIRWYHMPIIFLVKYRPAPPPASPESTETPRVLESGNASEIEEKTGISTKQCGDDEDRAASEAASEVPEAPPTWRAKLYQKAKYYVMYGVSQDVRNLDNEELTDIHAAARKFDDDTEHLFSFLQVITSTLASFAHGSNDVSNAAGPLSSIYDTWRSGEVDVAGENPVPKWILAMAGGGIVLGLFTLGAIVMRRLGNGLTYMSPSRGFSAELGTSLTVLTASQIGLPVSTTYCFVGSVTSIGLCNGNLRALNWKNLAVCFSSWMVTLPIAGLISGLLFAFASNAPVKLI
ncbi:hypothetical protein GGF46_003659 [Coemansia sp. RSA 552]|nr:hypothetical protein GGF46_003659 [Coemansia sp. RSA 552]